MVTAATYMTTLADDGCPLYLLTDHLGGTTHLRASSAAVLCEQKYRPYGATRTGDVTETDVQYTGKRSEPG